jgi:hypothetical protein
MSFVAMPHGEQVDIVLSADDITVRRLQPNLVLFWSRDTQIGPWPTNYMQRYSRILTKEKDSNEE